MKFLVPIVFAFLAACNESSVTIPPERVSGIPAEAKWAGGVDGGSWILCNNVENVKYSCRIYSEYDGKLFAEGNFIHRQVSYDSIKKSLIIKPLDTETALADYDYFDGQIIHLIDDKSLVPDGWIVWHFDEGHGKKIKYVDGVRASEEIEF